MRDRIERIFLWAQGIAALIFIFVTVIALLQWLGAL